MSMSQVTEFFRHCPACGRRFTIRLTSKQKVSEKEVTEYLPTSQASSPGMTFATQKETSVTEGVPVYVDVKEFNYNYKCTHCGHQWTEVREKDKASRS
jgi:predicted RNA-binding Zn-ribbon protein involved in translation (DUF1610 family)